ncbi:uncharacterized protein LOC132705512 isoform X2 [Cylas formicarius]|nr:uncharacterized protein LOC132705512 isoform X2 [Cylas formicarius]
MQSEEVDEAVSCADLSLSDKMTFSKTVAFVRSQEPNDTLTDVDQFCDDSIKLEDINLEDEIEKVEVTSEESSSISEEEKIGENPDLKSSRIFSGIPEENPSETVKNWLQKITEIQNEFQKKTVNQPGSVNGTNAVPNRVVQFQDLPYMGEITLENSKPRRGRKPKKADICHLIYKNYGTIFPGTPNANSYLEKECQTRKSNISDREQDIAPKNDVQNKIISSLLEKRLTQENKKPTVKSKADQNEPLNLCIRDLNQLKIRLLKKKDNTYTSKIKSEPQSDDDVEFPHEPPSPSISAKTLTSMTPESLSTSSPETPPDGMTGPGGYVYWPNAGVFLHPMALQQQLLMYQRLANNMNYTLPSHSPRPPPFESKADHSDVKKIVPNIAKTVDTDTSPQDVKIKRNSSASCNDRRPAKRKRSAIFIPPIPPENNSNPATEVSICKFKFTGGAKPSLQEKKMLSVDSGGNFRYYSGTGDKSMRGYEFFPRETLQQQVSNGQGSSTGAFLQASGEKIYPMPPAEIAVPSDFLLTPELPGSSLVINTDSSNAKNKKRKSRKSLQREKLEKTFKEKGFLIQTQQLESAEGATYCKFRQLRKFTRYLFRSWKDYLPGNVRDLQENDRNPANELPIETIDNASVISCELPSSSSAT